MARFLVLILAIVLTPFSRGSIEAKRAHLIHKVYKKSLEEDDE